MPAIYLGHGAPPLVDDPTWPTELAAWARRLPRPSAVLVVSAHWESAPLTVGATTPVPLTYDFWGFPLKYYQVTYACPGAPDLAARVRALMPDHEEVIPVLQVSMPTLDPQRLLELGRRLAPLRDEGVLIAGSGFLTHGLPFVDFSDPAGTPPSWSAEFDAWADEALRRGDVDELVDFRHRAPSVRYAHPTVEHLAPMFVTLGAAQAADTTPSTEVDGYWFGLSKRSFQVA
jgi:4,5-DOPA dioxygenase extradiol